MIKYLEKIRKEISAFEEFQVVQIPRTMNSCANALSKMASSGIVESGNVFTEILSQPSVKGKEILQIGEEPGWMDPIVHYLRDDTLPSDKKEARRLITKAAHYIFDGQALYKRSFSWPLLKCLQPTVAELAMREVHEGICGDHSGGKVLAHKILRRGFFWPTLQQDASDFVRKCEQCQKFATTPRLPAVSNKPISNPVSTTSRTATGESPFSLAFGVDAVISVEIGAHSPRLETYNEQANPRNLRSSLDLVEETLEKARVRMAAYQQRVARYYNSKMKERAVKTGDLVPQRAEVSDPHNSRKLAPTREGPYRVSRILQPGSYRLESLEGDPIPRTWHISNLKKFYQ
ncbi:uncharacterized protein LOC143850356 [Tasmannia lanceolata]|uniref:uncharacterized protein LOC143850356 n=1 Tax=Tasmannia lanceolata TaxID=3420 RepID=UPI004062BC99